MEIIYRLRNYKTFPLFKAKKVFEYSMKPKKELIKIIAQHRKDKDAFDKAINYLSSRQDIERMYNFYRFRDIVISFVKEALMSKNK